MGKAEPIPADFRLKADARLLTLAFYTYGQFRAASLRKGTGESLEETGIGMGAESVHEPAGAQVKALE